MIRRPPRSTRTDTLFPSRRSSDLPIEIPGLGTIYLGSSGKKVTDTSAAARATALRIDLTPSSGTEVRSEEHTSELQSLMRNSYAVFCLKKKKHNRQTTHTITQTSST